LLVVAVLLRSRSDGLLDIFREAQGVALSSRQIGEALAVRQGLESTTLIPSRIDTLGMPGIAGV
jgi:hypothetical protein